MRKKERDANRESVVMANMGWRQGMTTRERVVTQDVKARCLRKGPLSLVVFF